MQLYNNTGYKYEKNLIHIFIRVGAGVGKTQVEKAFYDSLARYYSRQPGENLDNLHLMFLALQ